MSSAPFAQAKRAEAARARRLANALSLDADRKVLLDLAEALDQQADALERQAAPPPKPILAEHYPVQPQQQQGEDRPPPRPNPG